MCAEKRNGGKQRKVKEMEGKGKIRKKGKEVWDKQIMTGNE